MKTQIRVVCILLAFLMASNLMAQRNKKRKEKAAKKTETVKALQADEDEIEIMSIDVDEESSISHTSYSAFEPVSNIRFNKKFEVYGKINDQYDYYRDKYAQNKSNSYGIVDKEGNVILPHLFGKSYGNSNNYEVLLYIDKNYGLFNLNELRWSIPLQYEKLSNLGGNLYSAKQEGKYGVIDNNNVIIVPFEWYKISDISGLDNYVIVTLDDSPKDKCGIYSLVDKKLTVPCEYSYLKKLSDQNYFLVTKDDRKNIVDINNIPRYKNWYEEIIVPSNGRNYCIVKINDRYGVIDDDEKIIVPIEYLEFNKYPYSDGSYLAKNKDGKYGFMLIDGRITLPFEYDDLKKTYNDNVVSFQNGKCGLVQVNAGAPYEIVTCNYDDIKKDGKTFIVEKDGKFGLMDLYGKSITEIKYELLEPFKVGYKEAAIFKAKKDGFYELINEQGKPIGDGNYLDILAIIKNTDSYYSNTKFTYLKAKVKNGECCVIDKVGKKVTKPIFDDVISEYENLLIVKSKGKFGIYSIFLKKLIVDYDYDLIIKNKADYLGISGKKIDILDIKSEDVTKISTTK